MGSSSSSNAKDEIFITPWETSEKVDYEKILNEFGVSKISEMLEKLPEKTKKKFFQCHILLRRNFYFSHRDFDLWLKESEKKKKTSVITGRGPSEKLHLGHLIPFLLAKSLQDNFGCTVFIPISDDEKFFVKEKLSYEDAITYGKENIIDILALGFKKGKTFVFQDFINTEIYRFAARIAKKITYSTVRAIFGLKSDTNIGWSFYPAMQAAHILMPQVVLGRHISVVPAGIDQDPFIRLTRDIAESFNFAKPSGLYSKFLPSLLGYAKMSASMSTDITTSKGNKGSGESGVIWLTDSEEKVREKIIKHAFSGGQPTKELQRKLGGNPDIDVSFIYLKMLFEPDDKKLKEIEEHYRSGTLLTTELKEILIEKVIAFLKEHQKRKEKVKKEIKKFMLDFSKIKI